MSDARMREPESSVTPRPDDPEVGAVVYWRSDFYIHRGTVVAHRAGRGGAIMCVLSDVRVKRRGGRNWMRERAAEGMTKNARHVETAEPKPWEGA